MINHRFLLHACERIAVAPVDNNRLAHFLRKERDIQIFNLRPFGENKAYICAVQGTFNGVTVCDVAQCALLEVLHADGVPRFDMRPVVQHDGDIDQGGRFPQIVGARLEREAQNSDRQPFQTVEVLAGDLDRLEFLVFVDLDGCLDGLDLIIVEIGEPVQRFGVLWKTTAAVPDARLQKFVPDAGIVTHPGA